MNKSMLLLMIFLISSCSHAITDLPRHIWSDGGKCAYDYTTVGITAEGVVWADKKIVETKDLASVISDVKRRQEVKCIMVIADKSLSKKSSIVIEVVDILENIHGDGVYFYQEALARD